MADNNPTQKPCICHVSLLNPALHSRIFYKEAKSLQAAGFSQIVIGRGQDAGDQYVEGIRVISLPAKGRGFFTRIFMQLRLVFILLRIPTDLIVFHTPELLFCALIMAVFRPRVKRVYDMHEDYAANFRFGGYSGILTQKIMPGLAAWMNRQMCRLSQGIMLAEECYSLPAGLVRPHVFIRNTFAKPASVPAPPLPPARGLRLICSGTLSPDWGVDAALQFWILANRTRHCELVLAGHTHHPRNLEIWKAKAASAGLADRLYIFGGDTYLPQESLLSLLAASDAELALYRVHEHLRFKKPTRFYTCMGMNIPLVFSENPFWRQWNEELHFGLEWKGEEAEVPAILEAIVRMKASPVQIAEAGWSWSRDAESLITFMKGLLA